MRSPVNGLLLIPNAICFANVASLSLLHRALLSGRQAGIRKWLILTWSNRDQVRASLTAAGKLQDISWQLYDIRNTTPEATRAVWQADRVVVISCTAAFDRRILLQLPPAADTVLCVTASKEAMTDAMAEGVRLRQGRVLASPPASPPRVYATGILCCPGDLLGRLLDQEWPVLQHTARPISVVLHGLIDATDVKALDISQYAWVPLTTPLEVSTAKAESQLIRGLGREGDSPLVRHIDRPISQALTKRLMHTNLTPNHITLISALIGLSGAILLAQPLRLWQVLGSLLFLFSTIMDGCDGEVARLTFQESDFGAKLDVIMDNVVHVFLFTGIALGLYRQAYQTLYLLLGGLTLGGILVSIGLYVPYLWRPPERRRAAMRVHEILASRDFAYALPFLALFGKLSWFLWAATIGTYVFAAALGGLYLVQGWQRSTARSTKGGTRP